MTNTPKKINSPNQLNRDRQAHQGGDRQQASDISQQIIDAIKALKTPEGETGTLKDYPIRTLVIHAKEFGPELKRQRLETNQVRKFLDAINQIKAKLPQIEEKVNHLDLTDEKKEKLKFAEIETDVVLLKPKLAYAAARQDAVKSLNRVMSEAIDKVHSIQDFERLVQLIESTIAYHKEKDGK
ncbi:type III-A CRISPR-associated protein Csm2 [Kovacikia minuta CCNUW1]|uniref:type III-A CRISPR-associated protein Csm2 n=1 Tax=Kovacikia minuta TaxID=2931930 RepID=UPI001CCA1C34|nr:type III-A CRISPR-associated protein Csm2 [Kovacikia minuta]UBF28004.1 type III-A CRISPR-associated protein Csm2 [Kovacikia minuta CCNUW1]